MINVFEYIDYRLFLKEFYETRKKEYSYFSLRYMSNRVGMDPGNIVKLFQGKRHLSNRLLDSFINLCKFNSKESKYFRTLVRFSKAKKENEIKRLYEELLSLKDIHPLKLRAAQYEFYNKWYYTAIAALLNFFEFKGNFKDLAGQLTPPITIKQAKEGIGLLKKLNIIKKDDCGIYVLTNNFLTTGDEWRSIAIRKFQEETTRLALESFKNHSPSTRKMSTLSISINEEDLNLIDDLTKEYRKSILKIVDETEAPNRVYQLNIQLFPLSKAKGADREES